MPTNLARTRCGALLCCRQVAGAVLRPPSVQRALRLGQPVDEGLNKIFGFLSLYSALSAETHSRRVLKHFPQKRGSLKRELERERVSRERESLKRERESQERESLKRERESQERESLKRERESQERERERERESQERERVSRERERERESQERETQERERERESFKKMKSLKRVSESSFKREWVERP